MKQPRQPLRFVTWRRTEPRWLRRLLPRQWLDDFTHVSACWVVGMKTVDEGFAERLNEVWRSLSYCTAVRLEHKSIPNEAVAALAKLPHLEFVSIEGVGVDRSAFTPWRDCDSLKRLHVQRLKWVGNGTLPMLRPFRGLEELSLSDGAVRDTELAGLRALRRLTRLRLDNTYIKGEGLEHLVSLGNLRSLSLAGNTLSGEGVEALARLRQLEEIDLRDTAFPAERLPLLLGMKNLRSLRLTPDKVYREDFADVDESDSPFLPPRHPATGKPLGEHPIHGPWPTPVQTIHALVHEDPADFEQRGASDSGEDENDDESRTPLPDWVREWLSSHAGEMGDSVHRSAPGGGIGIM
jgi:hypothetical protein